MYSGGKESVYAALLEWPVDLFLFLIYQFPRPSPHILNLGKAVELGSQMAPVAVLRLRKGREFWDKVEFLRKVGASEIVAGDVDVAEHLEYMERLAGEVGAKLKEPLWGADRRELLRRMAEELDFVVIGANRRELLCWRVGRDNVGEFISAAERAGVDVLGERGEYHTQVVAVRKLGVSIEARCRELYDFGNYFAVLI